MFSPHGPSFPGLSLSPGAQAGDQLSFPSAPEAPLRRQLVEAARFRPALRFLHLRSDDLSHRPTPTSQPGCGPARHLLESLSFQARGYPVARLGKREGPIPNSTLSVPAAGVGWLPGGQWGVGWDTHSYSVSKHRVSRHRAKGGQKVRQPAWKLHCAWP